MASDTEAVEVVEIPTEDRIRAAWNRERFEDLGFQKEIAELLAEERVDWHLAARYIEQGCSLGQVLRILL